MEELDEPAQKTYQEFLQTLKNDELLVAVYDPEYPVVFTERMMECIENYSEDDWNNAFERWFPGEEEVIIMKAYQQKRDMYTYEYFCTSHTLMGSCIKVEVEIIKYEEFIKLIKNKNKSFCKICNQILFSAVTKDDTIIQSLNKI
jgi:hypothetical protein